MADNVGYTEGAGVNIAADDVSSVFYQRMKISLGPDGTAIDARGISDVATGSETGILAAGIGPGFDRYVTATLDADEETIEVNTQGAEIAVFKVISTTLAGTTLLCEISYDGTNWLTSWFYQMGVIGILPSTLASSMTNPGTGVAFYVPVRGAQKVRFRIDTFGTGTSSWMARALLSAGTTLPTAVHVQDGSLSYFLAGNASGLYAQGNIAHDSVDSGKPVKIGGKASNSLVSGVQSGDRTDAMFSTSGSLWVSFADMYGKTVDLLANSDNQILTVEPQVPTISRGYLYNGSSWDRARSGGVTGMQGIAGSTAHDAVDAGNPVKIGGKVSASPTSVAVGDRVDAWFDNWGRAAVFVGDPNEGVSATASVRQDADGEATGYYGLGVTARGAVYNGGSWDRLRGNINGLFAQGNVAHDAADSGHPVKIGGEYTATPSAVSADGDRTNAQFDQMGKLGVFLGDRNANLYATVRDLAANDALNVAIVDGSGNQITNFGGGTQYVEDAAFAGNGTGTLMIARRDDALSALTPIEDDAVGLRVNSEGALWIALGAALPTGDNNIGNVDVLTVPVDPFGTNADAASATGSISAKLRFIAATGIPVTALPALPAGTNNIGDVDVASVPAPLSTTGNGTAATALRVTVASDSTGVVGLAAGVNNIGDVDVLTLPGVAGDVAHDAADSGNPIKIGGKALTGGLANTVAVGDRVDAAFDLRGRLGTVIYGPDALVAALTAQQGDGKGAASLDGLAVISVGYVHNGSTLDMKRAAPGVTGATAIGGPTAADGAIAVAPVTIGGRASTAIPTAVSADGDVVNLWANRNGAQIVSQAPHVGLNGDPFSLLHEAAQYSTTQTSAILITPTSGKKLVVTKAQIGVGGTTAGEMQLYFGDGAFSRGTSRAIFDHEWAPSATLKPGVVMDGPFIGGTDEELRVTDSAAINPLTVNVWYYEI